MNNKDRFLFNEFKNVSLRMGNNLDLIQANGGNTSIKIGNYLFIKASGKHLADINNSEIFTKVPLKPKSFQNHNNEIKKLSNNKLQELRPSIELDLHLLISSKVVLHSHPVDLIAQTMMSDGENKLDKLLEDFDWLWVDYCKPGIELATKVENLLNKKRVNILVLQNHGLVIGAETPLEAEMIQRRILEKVKLTGRRYVLRNKDKLKKLKDKFPEFVHLPKYDVIHSIANDQWSLKLSQMNPHCPDHAVFCGLKPVIISDIERDFSKIKDLPYIIIKNYGVILFQKSESLEAMLRSQAEIFLKIPRNEEINLLGDNECKDLINWEAEKLRKSMIK